MTAASVRGNSSWPCGQIRVQPAGVGSFDRPHRGQNPAAECQVNNAVAVVSRPASASESNEP